MITIHNPSGVHAGNKEEVANAPWGVNIRVAGKRFNIKETEDGIVIYKSSDDFNETITITPYTMNQINVR